MAPKGLILVISFSILLLTSCGSPDGEALNHIAHRADSASRVRTYSSLTELRDLVIERKASGVGEELVVLGTITGISRGASFSWNADDAGNETTTQYPFGDDRAMGHTVHLTVAVSEVVAPPTKENLETITVGLVFDSNIGFDTIQNDYSTLGTIVFFLKQSPIFDYKPGTYAIIEDGALMGLLKGDGTLHFPTMLEPEVLLDGKQTIELDKLRIETS